MMDYIWPAWPSRQPPHSQSHCIPTAVPAHPTKVLHSVSHLALWAATRAPWFDMVHDGRESSESMAQGSGGQVLKILGPQPPNIISSDLPTQEPLCSLQVTCQHPFLKDDGEY